MSLNLCNAVAPPMKIVHCLFTMETGGAQVLTVDLLNEMSGEHDVCLIIINNKFNRSLLEQLNRKVRIFYINRKEGSFNPIPVIRLNLLLLKLKPDIIHCHEPQMAKIMKTTNAKLIHTIHDTGLPTFCYHLYDKLIAVSEVVYQDVAFKCVTPVTKVDNGIAIDLFKRRIQYNLGKGETVKFIQVSRLFHEKKGQDVLVHALHLIKSEYLFSNFSIDFIGSGESCKYLKKLVDELDLSGNVRFLGERTRNWVFANLSAYHILVQPSKYEGFGLTVLEGFAAGLPVLASDIEGPAEIISCAAGGFLFRNGDSASCAQALYNIVELYRNNQLGDLMNKTIDMIKQKYSISSCSKQYLEEYSLLRTC
jgi:glycosyltransferase involved in cell wall biosynthesis